MQRTTNYNFKKPDYTDFADIQDINDNMDAIDAELAAPTGDLANATIKSSTASTASYPVPAANDTMKVMLGKIIKFCADIVKTFTGATSTKAGAKGLVPAPTANQHNRYLRADGTWQELVNDHTTTTAGKALDARQANPNVSGSLGAQLKSLNDSFTSIVNVSKVASKTGIVVQANSFANVSIDISSNKPVLKALQGFSVAGSTDIVPTQVFFGDNNESIVVRLRNLTNANATAEVYVWYK